MERLTNLLDQQTTTTKFTLTAAAASVLTATSFFCYQGLQHYHQQRQPSTTTTTTNKLIPHLDPHPHVLTGEEAILGIKKQQQLQDAFVIIVGAGGVGSWAALMLLRAGVRRLRVIDFDQVTLSSLNRHAVATLNDVGTPKVMTMARHFARISPSCQLDPRIDLFSAENAHQLLDGNPDYIIDAIDNINTKLDLIRYCYDHRLKVISSMGAGAKADPSRIQITDISETLEDPLARTVRRQLKKYKIEKGVPVAYSTEKPNSIKLLPLEEDRVENADDYAALPDFRSRILPVLGTLPSMFGMAIANHVILDLTQYPGYDPLPIKLRDSLYSRLYRNLIERGSRKSSNTSVCQLNAEDVGYIFEEMWHGKSVISGPQTQVVLVKWDQSKPLDFMNTVVMTREEAKKHEALPLGTDLCQHYGQDICTFVETKFKTHGHLRHLWNNAL
ncbi:hypothetical protein BC941DRAFT_419336 [Chlamydoabsidia padenii]|nr:hypothetical protein BC941DRAFT_419336 [Chlamydoabsidia padenii]